MIVFDSMGKKEEEHHNKNSDGTRSELAVINVNNVIVSVLLSQMPGNVLNIFEST